MEECLCNNHTPAPFTYKHVYIGIFTPRFVVFKGDFNTSGLDLSTVINDEWMSERIKLENSQIKTSSLRAFFSTVFLACNQV